MEALHARKWVVNKPNIIQAQIDGQRDDHFCYQFFMYNPHFINSFSLINNISTSTASTDERKSTVKYPKKQQITFNCRSGTLRAEVNDVSLRSTLINFSISKQMKTGRTNFSNAAKTSSHSHPIT